jgi:hypothetical protein
MGAAEQGPGSALLPSLSLDQRFLNSNRIHGIRQGEEAAHVSTLTELDRMIESAGEEARCIWHAECHFPRCAQRQLTRDPRRSYLLHTATLILPIMRVAVLRVTKRGADLTLSDHCGVCAACHVLPPARAAAPPRIA